MITVVILISGRGSNLTSLLNAAAPERCRRVSSAFISNRPDALGLQTAEAHGVPTCVIDHRQFAEREQFDVAVAAAIDGFAPDLVVLAGFMRILGKAFVRRYENRLINIHPSLLPAFPGLHTHRRALAEGVRIHGCTVHFVTPDLDHGPVIVQAAVPVLDDDDEATLAARVLAQEHQDLPAGGALVCRRPPATADGRVSLDAPQAGGVALIAPQLVAG
jgi:phosphoribosylglycinamide formyltransferase-1